MGTGDFSSRLRRQPQTFIQPSRPSWSCNPDFVFCLYILYQVGVYQLTAILGLVNTETCFLEIIFWKTRHYSSYPKRFSSQMSASNTVDTSHLW
uniref:Predicted protein n=1 Tax=Hordeum vulgare subsp. vulgare TaxID=112509 RepID=F2EDU4_HORVV|nr:predicted protein [Hordeum vulgare subsp. vulgare]